MLRFGPDHGPTVVVAPALFEEANRTRAFLVHILRRLAGFGIASALPDLPGQGESLVPTRDATLADWRRAFAAAVAAQPGPALAFAIRGGALVDRGAPVQGRYHLAPVGGASLVQELDRARRAASGWERSVRPTGFSGTSPVPPPLFAGNHLNDTMLSELNEAEPSTTLVRTVRLDTDPRPADRKFSGSPLWRRSEPEVGDALAAALADDIAAWVTSCAA